MNICHRIEQISESIHLSGYAIVDVSKVFPEMVDRVKSLKEMCGSHFVSRPNIKQKVQCEVVSAKTRHTRDRVELRRSECSVLPCLSNNQFQDGYMMLDYDNSLSVLGEHFLQVATDFFDSVHSASLEIFRSLIKDLGIEDSFFDETNGYGVADSVLRLLRYPSPYNQNKYIGLKIDSSVIGGEVTGEVIADDHTDLGFITVMFCSNVPGLQVLDRQYNWISIEEELLSQNRDPDSCMIVIVGEQMAHYSSWYFPPARHRVLGNKDFDRVSFPFFLRASPESVIPQYSIEGCFLPDGIEAKHLKPSRYPNNEVTLEMLQNAQSVFSSLDKDIYSVIAVGDTLFNFSTDSEREILILGSKELDHSYILNQVYTDF
eukprot:TRINITY_DN12564_c0_g1_i1.p1 TRINITY_DN12564_c0_g1~~TRINITY_DN12564_c0_g1_i1.p1  ORF type:complete len:374 (-),score=72.32 TRINITY_DN12564_c0_g1_i1:516-1637(-)